MKGKDKENNKIVVNNKKNRKRNYNKAQKIKNEELITVEEKIKDEDKTLQFSDTEKNDNYILNNKTEEADIVNKNKKEGKFYNIFVKNRQAIFSSLITLALCLLVFGIFYNFYLKNLVIETTKLEKDVTVTDEGIADAVEKVYDSVVVVETYVKDRAYTSGTGFVFKKDDKYGYIITNYHVIDNASSVKVTFTNNKTIDATIIGSDEYADIAVLAVDKDDVILVAEIGSSEDMRIGDTTFAVGAPIDSSVYSWSVTRGILSGKNRLVEISENTNSFIMQVLQTDTAINSGNSGGPLCNSNGEVIGITNMKLASSQIEGMGFAIPVEEAIKYANSIISGEKISRPYLGISIYDANSYFNKNDGVYIEYVENGGAAEKAGLQKGDKIIKVNDVEVSNTSYFRYELYKYNVGDKINITVERDGKEKTFKVTLGTNNDLS